MLVEGLNCLEVLYKVLCVLVIYCRQPSFRFAMQSCNALQNLRYVIQCTDHKHTNEIGKCLFMYLATYRSTTYLVQTGDVLENKLSIYFLYSFRLLTQSI